MNRFGPLDGLRGIAVLIVFFSHTSGRDMYIHSGIKFNGIGHIGVYLFFCLSAYLLGSKLLEQEIDSNEIKKFFIKRAFRIWPLYFIVLGIVLFYQYVLGIYNEDYLFIEKGLIPALQHFIFFRGDSLFWTVVAEEQFYIIVPFLLFAYQRKPKLIFWVCVIVAGTNFILYISKNIGFPFNIDWIKYISTNARDNGNYLDIFLGTFIMMFIIHRYKNLVSKKWFFIVSNFLFCSVLILSVLLVSEHVYIFHRPFYEFRYITPVFLIGFVPFIISLKWGNPAGKYLNWKLLKNIGLYGFSFYLLHFLVFQIINSIMIEEFHTLKLFIAFVSVYIISMLSFNAIEKPFINLGYKLSDKLR